MTKIIIKEPNGPYKAVIDTEVMTVEIEEAFLGVLFITKDGERLSVSMRDSGFEVIYSGYSGKSGFKSETTSFQNGVVKVNQ